MIEEVYGKEEKEEVEHGGMFGMGEPNTAFAQYLVGNSYLNPLAKTVIPYSSDYDTVVNDEQNGEASNHLPEIQEINVDLNKYDEIILGTPVWWYRSAPAIRTFLTKNNLKGKTIKPFATNAGWLGRTFKEIEKLCPDSNVESGMNIVFKSYSSNLVTSGKEINNWINKL